MNAENLEKFVVALDEFVKELFELKTDEAVVTTQDGEIYSSLFMVTFGESPEDGLTTAFISFNDAVLTSTLIKAADVLIPYISDGLEMDVAIDQCHFLKTNNEGIVQDILFEYAYAKKIKPLPKSEVKTLE